MAGSAYAATAYTNPHFALIPSQSDVVGYVPLKRLLAIPDGGRLALGPGCLSEGAAPWPSVTTPPSLSPTS